MLLKLLSAIYFFYKNLITPRDYSIVKEEMEYKIDYDMKYLTEDTFWTEESKDWDGILEEYYVTVTGRDFRNPKTPKPQRKENACDILVFNYK